MKINFCGDSFCSSDKGLAWPNLLANWLKADIIGLGKPGASHEHAFRTFDYSANYTVFCWTEPHRLYHPTYSINMAKCEDYKGSDPVYQAGYDYYKYIHDWDYMSQLQNRELYWFDTKILNQYDGVAVHLYSFNTPSYKFQNGIYTRWCLSQYKCEDAYANHMSEHHNKQLSTLVYNRFINNA